jgi:AraC-like DNA-binding protein
MDTSADHLDKTRPGFLDPVDEERWAEVAFTAHAGAHFDCAPSWELLPRTRPNYQIWLITGHRAEFTVDDAEPIALGTRSALVLPPGATHSATHDPRRPVRCYVLHFVARSSGLPAGDVLPPCALRGLRQPDWDALTDAAADMCEHLASGHPGRRLLANAAATRIVGLLRGAASGADSCLLAGDSPLPQPVAQMLRHVRMHHAEPLTLAAIAQAAHLSPERASHLFRAAVGISPLRYLRHYRLEEARRMLRDTDLPVAAIAARVGYADPFYFSRVFGNSEGMPPSGYRQSVRGRLLL